VNLQFENILEMQILLIHQYFLDDDEGGGSRWNEMSRIWVSEGHQVTVLAGKGHYMGISAARPGKYESVKINTDGVRVIRCHAGRPGNSGFVGRIWGYLSFAFSAAWWGIFSADKEYDFVLVTSPPLFAGMAGLVLSFWKRIPLISEIRDLWPESAMDVGILKNRFLIRISRCFEKYLYKKSRLINVLTPAFRNVLIDGRGVKVEKIIYIPNAADFHLSEKSFIDFDRTAFRTEHSLEGYFVVIYVGAHGIANHLVQMIEAAEMLQDTRALFLFIGGGSEKNSLMHEVENRGLKNVRFLHPLPKTEIFKFIAAADIGSSVLKKADVFKTVYSNKTFDYFSCKKPVLVAIDGVSRQLVEDSDGGSFVEPECPADFAAKVKLYMDNQELLELRGENGYRYAKAHFERNFLAKKYLNYLEHLRKPG
jgi:glycosyltransferase involved in cell wall biosynthesis